MSSSRLSKSACHVVMLHTNLLWPNVRHSVWWTAFVSLVLQVWSTFEEVVPATTGLPSRWSCAFFHWCVITTATLDQHFPQKNGANVTTERYLLKLTVNGWPLMGSGYFTHFAGPVFISPDTDVTASENWLKSMIAVSLRHNSSPENAIPWPCKAYTPK